MTESYKGSCHCGEVQFLLRLPQGLVDLHRCNCSLCRRKAAIVTSVKVSDLSVTKGKESLSVYQWNTNTAKHYFCRVCGIYTHHQRRSNPDQYGVNIACLQGVDPFALGEVPVLDGINHPSDR